MEGVWRNSTSPVLETRRLPKLEREGTISGPTVIRHLIPYAKEMRRTMQPFLLNKTSDHMIMTSLKAMVLFTNDPTRMEKARKHMAARILHLTLEIIHLITGEDYTVVKKWSGECVTPHVSGGSGTTQSPTPEEPPPHSLIHEQKILELTTRMTELLTGEVPIRCQDVTVYFSMEEWEYIEGHKDLYQDIVMMGDHRPPTSQDEYTGGDVFIPCVFPPTDGYTGDEVMDRNPPERCPRPLYSQDCPEGNVPEKHQGGDLTNNKVEEEEERMSGHHPCMREVKEEIPGGVTPENPNKDTNGNFVSSLNCEIKDEDIMQHSPGDDFLSLTVHPGPHSTDLSYNAPNHGEPSPDPSQVVTTRTDQREGKRFHCGECKKEFTKNSYLITHRRSHTEEKYSCSLCGKCFTDTSELLVHERMHIGENPYSCGERFTQKADPAIHILTQDTHSVERPYPCPEPNLVKHEKSHTRKMSYSCLECGKCFISETSLTKHVRIHTGERPYSCSECGKCYTSKPHLVRHQRIHTGEKPFSCSECDKCFTTKTNLVKHKRHHTGEKPYSCSECGKCFISKDYLVIHERNHTGEKPYSCSECGKCFISKQHLVRHERNHTRKKPYSFSECGEHFTQKEDLAIHQETHSVERLYRCTECGKCFTTKQYLVKHEKSHRRKVPYSCLECGKCFTGEASLIRHVRLHTGEKPYSCSECGKCYTSKPHLVRHQRIHTGEKPFPCTECGKCFTTKTNLVKHKRHHTGEKPYSCSECGKCFISKEYVVRHQRNHTGEKPYSCSECGKCFTMKSCLLTHLKIHIEEKHIS
ncbi:oocyte zinc finger protein XlCOF6-like isoform X2 [Hyla sarda]|uniref:oocyte zinc finger protein XlCOF6-like isoform X2 n=1 Tax=Hyla sarda TaxID=327740 RepID=UPI0024C37686|nr:oocyte zinc finger protein XlCOF6-like isoform X2 [Hyla sarda]